MFSININGAIEGFFFFNMCIRHGCPLSLFLLCISMDGLSKLLHTYISNGVWALVRVCNASFSHLSYVDVVIIFEEASQSNMVGLINLFHIFILFLIYK